MEVINKITLAIKTNFRFSTLNFIFIIAYVNIFQILFGPENAIVGVIFTIMMSASMVRDLTAAPVKHFLIQAFVLVWIALAAFWVTAFPAPLSFLINFITILAILYAFTYEYSSHIYFPYILSYLFLVFISPVNVQQLPKRILGMLIGAVSILLYQWIMGRNRVVETARDVLSEMMDLVSGYILYRLKRTSKHPDLTEIRHQLCCLSQTVYDRRKKVLCISDASFSMVGAGRELENLLICIHDLPDPLPVQEQKLLDKISSYLDIYKSYLHQEITALPSLETGCFPEYEKEPALFYKALANIHDWLIRMTDPERKTHYKKTALPLKIRLKFLLDLSPVRVIYAVRTALLLASATLLVQSAALPHGKWLLFTLASLSLPYADDVPAKIKKRILATLAGGLISVVIYALVPAAAGRTAAMMLSGYLSFYFKDYVQTFACSTIGALGGAVFMNAFGFQAVGSIFLIRLGYVLAGAVLAYIFNCLILPYNCAKATQHLMKKYNSVTEFLVKNCCYGVPDTQLYYNLVIQAHMQEEKLTRNTRLTAKAIG